MTAAMSWTRARKKQRKFSSTGTSSGHWKFRCTSTVLILYALRTQWKILVAPEVPMPYTSSIELSTVASHREHVKGAAAESSAPDVPVAIEAQCRSNAVSTVGPRADKASAPKVPNPVGVMHRSNYVSLPLCQLPNSYSVTGSFDVPLSKVLMPYAEKGTTAKSG